MWLLSITGNVLYWIVMLYFVIILCCYMYMSAYFNSSTTTTTATTFISFSSSRDLARVKYVGPVDYADGIFIGVELLDKSGVGKNSGA
jgi:hypothetical protein